MSNIIIRLFQDGDQLAEALYMKVTPIESELESLVVFRNISIKDKIKLFSNTTFKIFIECYDLDKTIRNITELIFEKVYFKEGSVESSTIEAKGFLFQVISNVEGYYHQDQIEALSKFNISIKKESNYRDHFKSFTEKQKYYITDYLVTNSSFHTVKVNYKNILDCSVILSQADFFLELGLVLVGPYGSIGNGIDIMEDYIIVLSERKVKYSIELRFFNALREKLGWNWCECLLDVFNRYNVPIVLN